MLVPASRPSTVPPCRSRTLRAGSLRDLIKHLTSILHIRAKPELGTGVSSTDGGSASMERRAGQRLLQKLPVVAILTRIAANWQESRLS